jgi:hypothetical protein
LYIRTNQKGPRNRSIPENLEERDDAAEPDGASWSKDQRDVVLKALGRLQVLEELSAKINQEVKAIKAELRSLI